jgi:S1-C subfamily serine protease
MDMEKLTKQQIVLVTLLVSFVTSIATGIVTVALMDQAPAGVTQTINRVVERTIEKVVTPPTTSNSASVITRETIVVKEDDKIVESVDKNKSSIVRIYTNNKNEESQQIFVGLGTIVSKEGLIVTGDVFADLRGKYLITLDNNKFYPVSVLPKKEAGQFYFLRVIQDEKEPITFTPIVFSDSDNLKLGQTVISWGGQMQNSVSTGIVSSLILDDSPVEGENATTTNSVKKVSAINTSINLNDSLAGGPLLNLYGEMVGLRVSSNISDKYSFLPVNILKQEVANYASVQ